jgi:hypothetical protein
VEESTEEGYCEELVQFILSLSEEGDSTSALIEKFFIYTQQVQAMADRTEYRRALKELQEFKSKDHPELNQKEYDAKLVELESKMVSDKAWWARLTDSVVKNIGRIADRESRSKDAVQAKEITIQQLNMLINEGDSVEKIDEKNNNH